MDPDTSCGLLVLLAFVLGAGAQSLPTAGKLARLTALVEALASFLGKADHHDQDPPPPRRRRGGHG